jgi:hypothetical protein
MSKRALNSKLQGISDHIDKLTYVLSMCDPRLDLGNGMECQFCRAKEGEPHKEDCIYITLVENK